MPDHVHKLIELTGTSTKTMEDAIQNAVTKASKSVRNMRWFEVVDNRGNVENGRITQWQVTVKIGFTLED